MKTCNRCRIEKPLDDFDKRKDTRDGCKYYCKACGVKLAADQRKKRPDLESKRQTEYYANNRDAQIKKAAKWTRDNRDRVNERRRETGYGAASRARYRAAKLQQTPAWADHGAIKRFYSYAAQITDMTGVEHEVDHIEPIQGKNVRGLHVPCNLQIITAEANKSKGNKSEN